VTINNQSSRGAAATSADQIGKVFIVVGLDVRKCLICEGVFTRRAASEHSTVLCIAGIGATAEADDANQVTSRQFSDREEHSPPELTTNTNGMVRRFYPVSTDGRSAP
jgi:hypothetical protein